MSNIFDDISEVLVRKVKFARPFVEFLAKDPDNNIATVIIWVVMLAHRNEDFKRRLKAAIDGDMDAFEVSPTREEEVVH